MKNYRELKFWERAHRLVVRTYEVTRGYPKEELVNLTATMRRTAMAVASPLVESFALGSDRESIGLVQNAIGTSGQLEYQLVLSRDLGYLDDTAYEELTAEVLELRRQLVAHLIKIKTIR